VALSDRDLKLLWARAAGLCSFRDCKENLVRFSQSQDGLFHVGEQAHLVARSIKGPRGHDMLSATAIDSYDNHILLCPTCHEEIDKSPADFTLELLKEFKDAHEGWVAEVLLANIGRSSPTLRFYADLLERLGRHLGWRDWEWVIDNAWRDRLPSKSVEEARGVSVLALSTIWPGTRPGLERALRLVMERWNEYVMKFEASAMYSPGDNTDFLEWRRKVGASLKESMEDEAEETAWSKECGEALALYVESLNDLVAVVRAELDPMFRQQEGWFIVNDSLGYRSNGQPRIYRPGGPREPPEGI